VALWRQQERVTPITRPLNYRDPAHPREKGIDVCIAVDYVMMAMCGEYDVGVLFSADTDLLPAARGRHRATGPARLRGCRWLPNGGNAANRLRVRGHTVWCHLLDETAYKHVGDDTDYTMRRRRR
jgi:hypothetical protein